MSNKCRIVYRDDGSVSVIHPVLKSKKPNETEEEWLERVYAKAMTHPTLQNCEHHDMLKDDLPPRHTRAGWEKPSTGKGIHVNEKKVKEFNDKMDAELKIQNEIRKVAIENLKAKGVLSSDFVDKR